MSGQPSRPLDTSIGKKYGAVWHNLRYFFGTAPNTPPPKSNIPTLPPPPPAPAPPSAYQQARELAWQRQECKKAGATQIARNRKDALKIYNKAKLAVRANQLAEMRNPVPLCRLATPEEEIALGNFHPHHLSLVTIPRVVVTRASSILLPAGEDSSQVSVPSVEEDTRRVQSGVALDKGLNVVPGAVLVGQMGGARGVSAPVCRTELEAIQEIGRNAENAAGMAGTAEEDEIKAVEAEAATEYGQFSPGHSRKFWDELRRIKGAENPERIAVQKAAEETRAQRRARIAAGKKVAVVAEGEKKSLGVFAKPTPELDAYQRLAETRAKRAQRARELAEKNKPDFLNIRSHIEKGSANYYGPENNYPPARTTPMTMNERAQGQEETWATNHFPNEEVKKPEIYKLGMTKKVFWTMAAAIGVFLILAASATTIVMVMKGQGNKGGPSEMRGANWSSAKDVKSSPMDPTMHKGIESWATSMPTTTSMIASRATETAALTTVTATSQATNTNGTVDMSRSIFMSRTTTFITATSVSKVTTLVVSSVPTHAHTSHLAHSHSSVPESLTPSPTVARRANPQLKTGRWDLEMKPARQTCGDAAPGICSGNINFTFSLRDNHDGGYTMDIGFWGLKKTTVAPPGRSGIVHAEWQSVKDPKNLECRISDTIEAWIGVDGEILVNEKWAPGPCGSARRRRALQSGPLRCGCSWRGRLA